MLFYLYEVSNKVNIQCDRITMYRLTKFLVICSVMSRLKKLKLVYMLINFVQNALELKGQEFSLTFRKKNM